MQMEPLIENLCYSDVCLYFPSSWRQASKDRILMILFYGQKSEGILDLYSTTFINEV